MLPDSGQRVIAVVRAYEPWQHRPGFLAKIVRKLLHLRHRFWMTISGSDIRVGASLGERLKMPHPNGVVIHQLAVIGDDCILMQQVTIGQLATGGAPILGSGVYVGAGAKILGEVRIGDGAQIGANAVVLSDVPAKATAVGVPARIILPNASVPK